MENSIEEYVEILERFSNENVIYGSTVGMTLEKYKDLQLSTEHILSDYKRVLKENEELKGLISHKNGYTKKLEEDLFENCSNYVVSVQKIKDKIEKEKLPLVIIGGRKNKKTLEYGIKLGRRQALRELIEERED